MLTGRFAVEGAKQESNVTTVLVLAQCPEIEALLADLVIFAGYNPVLPRADETAAAAMRRRNVDVAIVDAGHPLALSGQAEDSARTAAIGLVYCGSSISAGELQSFAESRGVCHFALPNGPNLLAVVLAEALERVGKSAWTAAGSPSPEIVQALRAVAEAQRLGTAARLVVHENRRLREERDALLDEARAGRDQLRLAVMRYVMGLRRDGISRDLALGLLNTAMRETAEAAGAPELLTSIGRDTELWVDEAYCAA